MLTTDVAFVIRNSKVKLALTVSVISLFLNFT
jgi:hypothetical protein